MDKTTMDKTTMDKTTMDKELLIFKSLERINGLDISNTITDHLFEFVVISLIICLLNNKVGFIFLILCTLFLLLCKYHSNYFKYNRNKINNILKNDPINTEINFKCRPSTLDNPYANFLIGSDPNIKACDDSINLQKSIDFNQYNLYENAKDKTFGSNNKAFRDFYTNPYTNYPNDNISFAKSLKNNIPSCKENNNCLIYEDIRYQSK